jgi:hypothetical protein
MGRKPRKENVKEYLQNQSTAMLFSTPAQFRECFGDMSERYLDKATGGTRIDPNHFRIVLHLPNKQYKNKEKYLDGLKSHGFFAKFLDESSPFYRSRVRWDAPRNPGAHLKMQTLRRKPVEFFLTPSKTNPNGAVINAQITFPTMVREKHTYKNGNSVWRRSEKLVACRTIVGGLWASASKKDKFKLTIQKPVTDCPKGMIAAGHAPPQFDKDWEPPQDVVVDEQTSNSGDIDVVITPLNAEGTEELAAEYDRAFYEAQGYDYDNLLEIQDVEIMDSETEQQAIERAYYNPSEAMVGTDETLDGYRPIDSATVDLTSNQPMANYGAEGETATYAPSDEPDMVSSSSFDEPTNANFSAEGCPNCGFAAEGETVADVEASVEPANEPLAVAEGTSLDGYEPIDSLEEGAPIGHGVNQYFGSAEGTEGALLDESTTNIGIEEGVSLDNFSGVDSVVVEAPLGHGVTQWYAEGEDGPQPPAPEGITGQDGPSDTPTNEYMVLSAEGFESYHAEGRTGFVFPKRKAWPIGNKEHAIKALNYMKGGFGDEEEYPKIRAAIKKKYGSLNLASEHHKGQGYDDEMDESLGMRHRGGHEQSFKDRRDEASAMDRKGRMGRKYDDVMAMDAQGYDDKMDESLGMRHRGSHSQSFKDRRDEASAMDKKHGGRKYHDVGTMDKFNAIVDGRDSQGRFSGRKTVHDNKSGKFLRQGADTAGYLQDGSLSMDGYTPLESVDVDRTSYQPTQNYGAEYEGENLEIMKAGALFGSGWAIGVALLAGATIAGLGLAAKLAE